MAGLDEAKVADMSGAQRRDVREALAAAYPNRGRLEELLDRLDKPLAHYAGEHLSLSDALFRVVESAKAEGWLSRLLAEATAVNPGNTQLAAVVGQYRGGTPGTPAAAWVGSAPSTSSGASSAWPATMPPASPTDRTVISELANQFPDLVEARRVVTEAGLSPGSQPGWNVSSANSFWWEVHYRFEGGVVIGGWPNVLRAACQARPGNAILAAAAAAAGVGGAVSSGGSPVTGPSAAGSPPAGLGAGQQQAPASQDAGTPNDADRLDFFISYTQVDQGWAEWIAWTLEEAGYRVLVQAWDMPGGTNWVAGMQKGVERAARTVAVLSAAYTRSVYGEAEWGAAWAADPDGEERKLLVFRIEACERPGLLGQVVSRDLFGIPQDTARATLLQAAQLAVGGGRAKPESSPPFPGTATGTPPFPPAGQ